MLKEVTAQGETILEAKENARLALGADELADVKYEILHAGLKGFLGFGKKPAIVKASIELPDAAPRRERTSRPEKKQNRPAPAKADRVETNDVAAEADAVENSDANAETPAAKKHSRNRRRKNRNTPAEAHQPVEKATAVFESELSFEKIEPAAGEDKAFDFITTLVKNLGVDATVEMFNCSDGTRRINIDGESASLLIGHHGDTLDAVQYLANLACAQKNENGERDRSRVTVNIEGYRAKREETLRTLARAMAMKALRTHRNVTLEPMSPYERRIIHSEIQGIDGVATNSVGTDNNRKVVIYLKSDKVAGKADAVSDIEVETETSEAEAE